MRFGAALGTACASFALTNIDDMFVLVTFFAEASNSKVLTPLKITIGQYLGFTFIVLVSMIGFAVAVALPTEPIGFLGLVPILLAVWKALGLLFDSGDDQAETSKIAAARSILKVASITIMNGGDNISVYTPLFPQAKSTEIAVYVVTFYILLAVWCFVAFLVMRQRHILHIIQKYANALIPLLYLGLGIYITVNSSCYPWSIRRINASTSGDPGRTILSVTTTFALALSIGILLWLRIRKRSTSQRVSDADVPLESDPQPLTEHGVGSLQTPTNNPEAGNNSSTSDTTTVAHGASIGDIPVDEPAATKDITQQHTEHGNNDTITSNCSANGVTYMPSKESSGDSDIRKLNG